MDTRIEEDVNNDLEGQHSKNPAFAAAGSPQLRELAQVFTHALSAYLQDPETFRKILSEIRPTEPPAVLSNEIPYRSSLINAEDFQRQESKYPLPGATTSAPTVTVEDLEVLDFSDVTISTRFGKDSTESLEPTTTTTETSPTTANSISSETFPPISTNLIDRTPGSRQLTSGLERVANARQSKALRTESPNQGSFRLADEINGGLGVSTLFPYDDSRESSNNDTNDYFPVQSQTRTTKKDTKPYGADVKPSNSTPIQDSNTTPLSENRARNFKWGDEISTIRPIESNAFPSLFSELLPPLAINKTKEYQVNVFIVKY